MANKRRYAVIGVGQRSRHFIEALLKDHAAHASLVALVDANVPALETRAAELRAAGHDLATYAAEDFEGMVAEARPETIIILTPDHTHAACVVRAMDAGCDVIVEKPMTTTVDGCREVLEASRRTGRTCRVAFNYRYAPWNTAVKRLLVDGVIGRPLSVAMRKALPMHRGASYFHRWHGEMAKSGGLLVHKATHYLDLVNFFLGSVPLRVWARGGQKCFTEEAAGKLGLTDRGERCAACPSDERCPFYTDVAAGPESAEVVAARGSVGGYFRDLCVFRPEADIPDTMHVAVEYVSGAVLVYTFLACGDGSSDTVIFGTHGRLVTTGPALQVIPYYGDPYEVHPEKRPGSHGGADPVMFTDLFDPAASPDPYCRAASEHDGAWSVLVAVAAHRSMATGEPIELRSLAEGLEVPDYAPARPEPEGLTAEKMRAWSDARQR